MYKLYYLEEFPQGFNEGEVQILREPPHIVVGLDGVAVLLPAAWWRAGLNHIRVQCPLQTN